MSTLTVRLPNDTHQRLRLLAKERGLSLNKLMEELLVSWRTDYTLGAGPVRRRRPTPWIVTLPPHAATAAQSGPAAAGI
jgi:hypothetical protein